MWEKLDFYKKKEIKNQDDRWSGEAENIGLGVIFKEEWHFLLLDLDKILILNNWY